jgi:hypothetical protein
MNIGRLGQGLGRLGIQGSPSSTLWTPTVLGSDIQFWSDANTESSLTLNNQSTAQTASQWNDISGNNRHLAQATAGAQPTLVRGMGNLLRYTQEFDNAYWANVGTPTRTANTHLAPDGTMTADTLEDTSTSLYQGVVRGITIPNDTQSYTFSIYVRKTTGGNSPTFGLNITMVGGTPVQVLLRLNTDTGVLTVGGTVESVGDYWRVSRTITNNNTGNTILNSTIYPATSNHNGANADTTFGVGSAAIWGAMLNAGSTANEYIGRNALATDGVDDFMLTSSFVLTQPFTRVTVATRRNASASTGHLVNSRGFGTNTALFHNTATDINIFGGVSVGTGSGTYSNGQTSQFGEIYNGVNSSIFNNGTGVTGDAGTNQMDGVNIGSRAGSINFSQNDIHSVIILNRLPTTDERQRIEGYLAHRYGIQAQLPVAHPYKELPPTL